MKNFLVLSVTILLGCLGYDAFQPPPPRAPRVVATAAPAPAPTPKVYFHSSLDAPAMPTGMTSGASYFSTDPNSRFTSGYGYGATGSYWNRETTYIVTPGGRTSAPANPDGRAGVAGQVRQIQGLSYLSDNAPRATPNPNGSAR